MTEASIQQRIPRLIELFQRSPVQQTLGTRLRYDDLGHSIVQFAPNHHFDNALGATHGGIIATLLDTAGWFAVAPAYDTWIATVDLHVQLLAPAEGQALTATGQAIRTGTRLAMARMTVVRDDGTEIASGQGTFSKTGVSFRSR